MVKVVKFLLGVVVGFLLAYGLANVFVYLIFSEDELQKKVAQKARCKTYEEMFFLLQSPEEKLEFLEKHGNILAQCEEVSHE